MDANPREGEEAVDDQLCHDPKAHLNNLLQFLGLQWSDAVGQLLTDQVNPAAHHTMIPKEIQRHLAQQNSDTVRELCVRLGGYPGQWKEEFEQVLNG